MRSDFSLNTVSSTGGCSECLGAFRFFFKQHSDLGACCTLNFFAARCECIHLTRVHVHCCTGILLIFAYYSMDTDARVMVQTDKNKVSLQVQPPL